MADLSSVEIPKPLNWQDFQRACVVLFRNVLGDPNTQGWGREGQDQHGIDIFGFRDGNKEKPVGVQCKRIEDPITESVLRRDINKARHFTPRLTELIFATTSVRDAGIQAVCVRLTLDLHNEGWPCRVVVMGWDDLSQEIVRYPEALEAFRPGVSTALQAPVIDVVREEGLQTRDLSQQHNNAILEKLDRISNSPMFVRGEYDPDLEPDAHSESPTLHAKISTYRDLIEKRRTKTALDGLLGLLQQASGLPPYARYRVLANVAAVHFKAGRYSEALDYAQQAHALRPNDPKAQSNLALAELVNGDAEGALRRAQEVLAQQPASVVAGTVLIQAKARLDSTCDPLSLVPDQIKSSSEVVCAAILTLRQKDDPSWRELARKSLVEYPGIDYVRRFAAEAELEPILANPEFLHGRPLPSDATKTVARCAVALKELWDKEIGSEDIRTDELVSLSGGLVSALRFLSRSSSAAEILDKSIAKAGPHGALVRARALIFLEDDEHEKAVEILGRAINDPEAKLMFAQIQASKAPDKALALINEIDPSALPVQLRNIIPEIRGAAALELKDAALLEVSLGGLSTIEGSFTALAILRSQGVASGILTKSAPAMQAEALKDAQDAHDDDDGEVDDGRLPAHLLELIRDVKAHDGSLNFGDRAQIAQYLEHNGAYEAASNLLHGRVDLTRDTVALRIYLSASVGAHLTARTQAILRVLPESLKSLPKYQHAAAIHYWNTGDVLAAAPLIEAVVQRSPQRLDLFLWHIDCLLRLGQTDRIRDLLARSTEDEFVGSVEQRVRLAVALNQFGEPGRALRYAYREFARNRNSPDAWMGFMSVMLAGSKADDMNLLSNAITSDHVFSVRFPDGSEKRYLIETDAEVRNVEADAIPPDNPVARLVLGHKPEDRVVWVNGEIVTIIAAKHKLLDAFHSAMARFNERFPAAKGFKQVSIKTDGEDALEELKIQLKARSEYVLAQSRLYGEGRMPLGVLAYQTGVDPIDTMLGLGEVGVPYRVAVGLTTEREAARDAIAANAAKGCVVDAATYHCIRRLDLLDVVVAVCGPICISQATADIYDVRLQKLDTFGHGPAGSVAYRDGKVHLVEYTAADRDAMRAIIIADRDWLSQNAIILPASPLVDPPPALRRLAMLRNAPVLDDAFAASGAQRLLLVDDLLTRQVAGLIGVRGTSLQPVLMVARDRGILNQMRYTRALTDLISMGQTVISIDAATLHSARQIDAETGENGAGPRYTAALQALGGRHADSRSHCGVAITYLTRLWSNMPVRLDDYAATSHLLRALLKERSDDFRKILNTLDDNLRSRAGFSDFLREWARGHFLDWPAQ